MMWIPLLAFVVVLAACGAAYLVFVAPHAQRGEIRSRLSLLEVRRLSHEDLPDYLKNELLSDVPPLNQILSKFQAALRIDRKLRQAGLEMRVGTFVLLSVTMAALGVAGALVRHWPLALALVVGGAMSVIPNSVVNVKKRLRQKRFLSHFPDALEMFARSLRAGHSFTGAIQLVAQEMPNPISPEFQKVFDEQNLGIPLRQALLGMTERIDILEVKFFVTAILIQRETGGNLAEIIDKIAQVIRERFRIQGQLKIFTAQARLTGIILGGLPIGVAVLIHIMNPDYLRPLLQESIGKAMIGIAAVLQVAGALVIRKIIRIKI